MPKKIIIPNIGGPEVLKYVDYELPKLIEDESVRIKHTSIGLNYIDTYHRSGLYPLPTELPVCPGIEAAGEIIELGKKVRDFKVGDRVCYAAPPLGAYCEIRDFPSSKLIKIPTNISNDVAASIILQGMTVEYLFERLYKIKKNEFILFHAAAGGVGLIACQWAKSIGCNIIGTVSTKEKEKIAKNNGCTHVINYKEENVLKRVNEITNNKGVPVVYDGVGKETFKTSLDCLSLRGLFVSFGQSSGMIPQVDLHQTFNPKSLYYTRPTLMHYNSNINELKLSSNKLFEKLEKNEIKDNITKIFELKEAAKAHTELQSRSTTGSIIFRV